MARLVSARCPQCGANVRLDPDREWVTCEYCNTSSFVQTPKRRPTENLGAHQPIIVVKRSMAGGFVPVLIGMLVFAALGIGLGAALYSRATPEPTITQTALDIARQRVTSAIQQRNARREGKPAPTTALLEVPELRLFENATPVARWITERLGVPVQALQVLLYPNYAVIEAQDPNKTQNVDRHTLRQGATREADPVRLTSRHKKNLGEHLFALDSIDWSLVPKLVQDAPQRLEYEAATVSHLLLRKDPLSGNQPRWRVYARSARDSGSVEYTADGKLQRIHK